MSSALRLWTALGVLALALGVLVWSSYWRDRELTAEIQRSLDRAGMDEERTRRWAEDLLNEISLQLGQSFLLGLGDLDDLDQDQRRLLQDRILMLVRGETGERLEELRQQIRQLALERIETLSDLDPEEIQRLRRRVEDFALGSRDDPLVLPRLHGPIVSVLVVSREGEIVASSDERVEGQRFERDEAERRRLARALEDPFTHPLARPGEDPFTDVYVPLRVRNQDTAVTRAVGVLKFRYRGHLAPLRAYHDPPPVPSPDFPWSLLPVVLVGLIGLGFGFLATRQVSRLTRSLEDLARRTGNGRWGESLRGDAAFRALAVMEERFESLEEGARDKDRILEWLTGSLEEGVVVLEADGTPRSINRWALEHLDLGPAQEAREAFGLLLTHNPDLRRMVEEAARQGLGVRNRDLTLAFPGGGTLGVRLTLYVLKEDRITTGLMLIVKDLRSIERLERSLREASRLETLARLSASVAHEIKNPLGSVGIHLELLRRRCEREGSDPMVREQLRTIGDEIGRLDTTIREFMGMTGPDERDRVPADVNRTLTSVAHFLRVEARDNGVSLSTELAPQLPPAAVPPGRLKQAILNLALNGIQAMPEGGRLTLRSRPERDGRLIVEVMDTGGGIPASIRQRIFDLHFTTKDDGSGLGLAITRQILEEAGGSVEFFSEPEKETRFRAFLPVYRGLPASATQTPA